MQFSLQLCYAITLNKSQGQTLKCVGIDLRDDSFSHGHTYVGFGRVRNRGSIMILVRDHRVQGFDFRFWRALDADWWENEPVKTGLDGLDVAGRGQE